MIQKVGKTRYMQIGARIGLSLAVLAELAFGAYAGFIEAILASLAVPFMGELFGCLGLLAAIAFALVGFYLGMLSGLIAWGITRISDN